MNKTQLLAIALTFMATPSIAAGPKLHSSIQVSSAKLSAESQEECNTKRLFKLAKITKEQAKRIASKRYQGKFGKIDLENEEGNLIWSVEIGKHELAIDAGNGYILAVD